MTTDKNQDYAYPLLLGYLHNGIEGRGFLLRTSFFALKQIEKNEWFTNISEDERYRAINFIQLDIISKIMMYIEDLAVISESFLNDKSYYEILEEPTDLGIRIGEFYKGIDDLSDEKLSKLLSYATVNEIDTEDEQSKKIIQNIMLSNIKEFKKTLKEIGMFSKTHHPLFKRFKHGGIPIMSDIRLADSNTFLSKFDSFNIVCFGKNAFNDIIFIPNSKEIMEKYKKIIEKLQDILKEIVYGRIICIQRSISGRIPVDICIPSILSKEESDIMNVALEKFYSSHPPRAINPEIKINKNIKADDLGWYSQL